ncbi:MAG: putative heme d1 biosynthesis radical SAM protein NirJ2 [Syntrophomonadaceae bacterium]|nr:putative heme d1 biosynthesis radical SAM protein NirJ2 [Syntrophomonadaceae bacterium]
MIVSWNTTNQCNMFCEHCYRDAGARAEEELDTAEGKRLIEQIARAGFKIMIFSGGEPLMRPDIVPLVTHARAQGLRPVFGTNGTLLTLDLARQLKEAGTMGMGISLDSMDPQKHDDLRKYSHAWQEAVQGMKNCREAGLAFQIHTTAMEWNEEEIEKITDFAVEMGAVAHHIFFLVPTGRAVNIEEEALRVEKYERLLQRILTKQQQVPIELKPTCAPQFIRMAQQRGMKLRFQRGCLAGTSYCIISPRGLVQPCAYLELPVGNVREQAFDEIWQTSPVLQRLRTQNYGGKCAGCQYVSACGGCRARAAYYHQGDYMAEDEWCRYPGGKEPRTVVE